MRTISGSPRRGPVIVTGLLAIGLVSAASLAAAQVMGMPGLDATKPIGPPKPAAGSASDEATSPPDFTQAQVERGRREYLNNCVDCHGSELNNGEFGGAPLKGAYFDEHWGGVTVDGLFGFIAAAMPPNRPGSLSPQAYADVTAFILERNGFRTTGTEMPDNMEAQASMLIARP